jgi:hypothetical protein
MRTGGKLLAEPGDLDSCAVEVELCLTRLPQKHSLQSLQVFGLLKECELSQSTQGEKYQSLSLH